MRPLHKVLIGLLIAVAMIAGFSLGKILHPRTPATLEPAAAAPTPSADEVLGRPRPDFTLPDLANQPHSIGEWDGQVLLINFWATWCAPCREEIPLLQRLRDEYGPQGFEVVGVALDLPDMVAEFQAEKDVRYPLLHGRDAADRAMTRYGNRAGTLPYTVIVDRAGIVRHIDPRPLQEGPLRAQIAPLLQHSHK